MLQLDLVILRFLTYVAGNLFPALCPSSTIGKKITTSRDGRLTTDKRKVDPSFTARIVKPDAPTELRSLKENGKRSDFVFRSSTGGSATFRNSVLDGDRAVSVVKKSYALNEKKKHSTLLIEKSSHCVGSDRNQSSGFSNRLVVRKCSDVDDRTDHISTADGNDDGNAAPSKDIMIYTTKSPKRGCKRSYDKVNFCTFCGRSIMMKISRHLLAVHKHEKEVMEIKLLPKWSLQRCALLKRLANEGNFKHNVAVLKLGHGKLVVARRSKRNGRQQMNYLPCEYCYDFFLKQNLSRHYQKCLHRPEPYQINRPTQVSAVQTAKAFLSATVCMEEDAEVLHLLDHMRDDEVKKVVMQDSLIRRFAHLRLESFGRRSDRKLSDRHLIISGVRRLAKLVLEARSVKEDIDLDGLLCASNFDLVIQATKSLSTNREKPALNAGRLIGHLLNHAALIKNGIAIREDDERRRKDVRDFLKLHKAEWTYRINSAATKRINNEKRLKTLVIPITEDLQSLRRYIMFNMKQYYRVVKEKKQPSDWVYLAKLTLSRLIMFNKRRPAEVKDLKMREYLMRPKWHEEAAGEMAMALSATDRLLAKRYSV